MMTFQGETVPVDGDGVPSLETMGVSLGRIVRFCGHTRHWYSVLGHSRTVAALLPAEYGIHGLMHDTPEVCMSDVPTPWKTQVHRNREHRLLKRIYLANDLDWPRGEDAEEALDVADHKALVAEAYVLEHPGYGVLWTEEPEEDAVEFTHFHLEKWREFMVPEIAGPIFEEAFKTYVERRKRSLAAKAAHARKLVDSKV